MTVHRGIVGPSRTALHRRDPELALGKVVFATPEPFVAVDTVVIRRLKWLGFHPILPAEAECYQNSVCVNSRDGRQGDVTTNGFGGKPGFWSETTARKGRPPERIEALTKRRNDLTEKIRAFWATHHERHSNAILEEQEAAELKRLLDERDEATNELNEW